MRHRGTAERIGFVGTGMMGAPMARAIASRAPVTVYDADADKAHLAAAGHPNMTVAASRDVLADRSVLITMLPTSDIVETVLLTDGLARALQPGSLVIDMSSSVPARTVALGRTLAESGLMLVDSPVSGGVARAEQGALTAMAGGEEQAVARARPVLELMASRVIHVGSLGSGHAAKALNNALSACGLLIATEATEVARRFGRRPETFLELVNVSTGRNDATENKIAKYVLSQRYDSGFAAALMAKDLWIAEDLAQGTGAQAELLQSLARIWQQIVDALPPGADQTEVGRYLAANRAAGQADPELATEDV